MAKQDLYLENEKIGYISSTRVNKKKSSSNQIAVFNVLPEHGQTRTLL